MSLNITADTDADDVKSRLGAVVDRESIRTGGARTNRLRKNVRRQARDWGVTVEVDPDHDTAHVDAQPDQPPHVVISGREFEQPVTGLPGRAWDWEVQRSLGVHEVGHIRYSDIDDKNRLLDQLDDSDKGTAHSLWNAAEDGAIEAQVTRKWPTFYESLRLLRANLFDDGEVGIPDPEAGGQVFPVAHAAQAVTLDLWMRQVYDLDIGLLKGLLDPSDGEYHFATDDDYELFTDKVLPACEDLVDAALTTPQAEARNQAMFGHIERILDALRDADADGKSQQNGKAGDGDDGTGMPDDSRESHSGGAQSNADELDPDAEPTEPDEGGDDDGAAGGSDSDPEPVEDVSVDPNATRDAAEEAADDARAEAGVTDDLLDEIDNVCDAVEDANDGDGSGRGSTSGQLELPTHDRDPIAARVEEATAQSGRLAQLLRNRLQHERRTETRRDQRRGRLDSSSLHRTAVGETRVKQRKHEPEEKDYHGVVVLDRSGSMAGRAIEAAETAGAMLMLALEEVGVDTMGVELHHNDVVLAKPFNTDTDARLGNVLHGETRGGTPLHECVSIARERLNQEGGNRFMFVITDGKPGSVSRFQKLVQSCTFPVVGITIGTGSQVDDGIYHRSVTAAPGDDIGETLGALVQEVMF